MLTFVSTNRRKKAQVERMCAEFGITMSYTQLDTDEIQHHDPTIITLDKARKAFAQLQTAIVVNDDSWLIPALNNFPGAYMKYVTEWFSPEDFINLLAPYNDRTVILYRVTCFKDDQTEKIFTSQPTGHFLDTPYMPKKEHFLSHTRVITLREDQKSIAQAWEEGLHGADRDDIWTQFAHWYTDYTKSGKI
jgi:inosine/xanthosine triphosphate pyrophosphatase family protein